MSSNSNNLGGHAHHDAKGSLHCQPTSQLPLSMHGANDDCGADTTDITTMPALQTASASEGRNRNNCSSRTSRSSSSSSTLSLIDTTCQQGDKSNDIRKPAAAVDKFPYKLHFILADIDALGMAHIVGFQPHGRAFRVHQIDLFELQVLPKWFRQSKFASFQRQLNIYDFRRITRTFLRCGLLAFAISCACDGPDKGAYYHERFIRGQADLTRTIPRLFCKGTGTRRLDCPGSQPNFYGDFPTAVVATSAPKTSATSMVQPLDLLVQAASSLCSVHTNQGPTRDALSMPLESIPLKTALQRQWKTNPNDAGVMTIASHEMNEPTLETLLSTPHNNGVSQRLFTSILDLARFRTSHPIQANPFSPALNAPFLQHDQQAAVVAATFESQRYAASWPAAAAALHNSTYIDPTLHGLPFFGWSSEQQHSLPFASMHSAFEPSVQVIPTILGNSGDHAPQSATTVYLGFPY